MSNHQGETTPLRLHLMRLPHPVREKILELVLDLPENIEAAVPSALEGRQQEAPPNLLLYRCPRICGWNGLHIRHSLAFNEYPKFTLSFGDYAKRAQSFYALCSTCKEEYYAFAVCRVNGQLREEALRVILNRTFDIHILCSGLYFAALKDGDAMRKFEEMEIWRARKIRIILADFSRQPTLSWLAKICLMLRNRDPTGLLKTLHIEVVADGNVLWSIGVPDHVFRQQNIYQRMELMGWNCGVDNYDISDLEVNANANLGHLIAILPSVQVLNLVSRIHDACILTHLAKSRPAMFQCTIKDNQDILREGEYHRYEVTSLLIAHQEAYLADRIQGAATYQTFRHWVDHSPFSGLDDVGSETDADTNGDADAQ